MKKIIKLSILVSLMYILVTAINLSQVYAAQSENYEYEILENGTAEITRYTGMESDIAIPEKVDGYKVTSIGNSAFRYCENLKEVIIPEGITNIGAFAFESCVNLTRLEVPYSVTQIGNDAFSKVSGDIYMSVSKDAKYDITYSIFMGFEGNIYAVLEEGTTEIRNWQLYCDKLKEITIPNTVTKIGDSAFQNNTGLTEIILPESLTSIGYSAFFNCKNLQEIVIPKGVKNIGASAFASCTSLKKVDIQGNIETIAEKTFYECTNLKEITIQGKINSIEEMAFWNCESLEEVILPEGLVNIGERAFCLCKNLMKVTIPNSVSIINNNAFSGCNNLTTIYGFLGSYAETFAAENNYIFINMGEPKNIADCIINEIGNQNYIGKAITPEVTINNGNTTLINGTDYIVTYRNNTNIGTATVTITGQGNYTGTITKTFKILQKNIANCTINEIGNQNYTGKAIAPKVTINNGNTILKNGTDYTVTYKNNTKIGKATITITGKGNYIGTKTKTFKIVVGKIKGVATKKQDTKSITLKWSRDKAVNGYEIYMSTKKNSGYKKVATISKNSTTSYKKTKLSAGKTYYFKIRAYKTVNKKKVYGSYSSILTTSTKTKAPKISKVTAGKKKATVKWGKVTGATGYEVYMSTKKNSGYKKVGTTTKNSKVTYTKTKLKSKKKYYFKVRTYRTVAGKKIYSSYSNIKYTKVK